MEVVVVPEAERQIRSVQEWWRTNRLASPRLFVEELAAAIELITRAPRIGRRVRRAGVPGLRRILMRATRYHLYYANAADGGRLFVLAIWSAARGGPPPMPIHG